MTSSEGEALLAWMNTFPEVQPLNITNFSDLRDGKGIAALWNAVHQNKINVDALGTPSGPTDWLTCLKNLREVDKIMSPILTEKGLREKVDITKISRQGDEGELLKFSSPLVIIAASSPLKREVIARIKSLSPQNRKVIQTIIQNFANKKKELKANSAAAPSSPKPPAQETKTPPTVQTSNDKNQAAANAAVSPNPPVQETKTPPTVQTSNDKNQAAANAAVSPNPPAQEEKNTLSDQRNAQNLAPNEASSQKQNSVETNQASLDAQQQKQPEQEKPQSQPIEKTEAPQQPKPQQKTESPQQQPMKIENFEILVREAESKIEDLKKEIESHDAQLIQLQEQANKKFKKADQSKAQYIDQTERMIADIANENNQNSERLEQLRKDDQVAQNELVAMKARIDVLQGLAQKTMADHQKKRELFDSIKKLEDTITENAYLEAQIQQLQEKQSKIGSSKNESNSNSILDDENDVLSPQEMDAEIERIKEDITTSIMLADKYGNSTSENITPADNENHETVPELATRITQMEIELAVIKDAVQSGQSGIPPDLLKEQKELSKVIKKLMKRREELEKDIKLREQLRQDMRRVQQTMVEQREEVEKELEKLTDDINARNTDLTNWLSFSSSFDAWRGSSTFLTDLRKSYL